ncbi:glycosyl hydrolase [Luteolibacter flavescens]|uniref:Glycosyl hydrolase n=1 Tax=Luteolibacter flavescens TaxID=1859460 RepID=A0ABT3FJ78_9BACT|nr:glycosyl hydrolase [Luteolibacter flavescens]MCW1883621.1 glycosyl hydrolase [Luteolibacter flavescens]
MKPIALLLLISSLALADDTAWPAVTNEAKPWTRWWWLGSGVDAENLTRELEAFSKAGLGGVEICPIYGAKGYEDRDLTFLSEKWTAAYAHAARESARLGMGIDLTTGTGWPFGGPWVEEKDASASLKPIVQTAGAGQVFRLVADGKIEALTARSEDGQDADLMDLVKGNRLTWTPAEGTWRVHGLASKHGIQKVKRAAPGGAGWVLDPFSPEAIANYLKPFGTALDRPDVPEPRAHFHDSFEYYGAGWTDELFARFEELRGYDLRTQLPAFNGEGDAGTVTRVRADYRETMSDLHREYLAKWHDWVGQRGSLTRNQAHGSPGNLLDHYAVADIPETEIFRHVDEVQIPMLQFASSAAHATGKKLVSAETFTWLGEHFQVTPAKLKEAADFVWLGGVNHIVYHGISYSPADAPWPGWLFYASTHMGPNGGLWKDLPAFNSYIARVQSHLQAGRPDADVLLYFPIHDIWHDGSEGLPLFTMHNQEKWLHPTAFYRAAMDLWKAGVPCDYVSERLLADAKVNGGLIELGGSSHKLLVIPETRHLSPDVARRLIDLAEAGATVVFMGALPADVPGLSALEDRKKELAAIFAAVKGDGGTPVSRGRIIVRGNPEQVLAASGSAAEPLAKHGLRFVRRRREDGWCYFIVNTTGKDFREQVTFATPMKSAVMLDPMTGRSGVTEITDGIHLSLAPGESRIIRTFSNRSADGPRWTALEPSGESLPLAGTWKVSFLEGGPALPASFETSTLGSWTEQAGDAFRSFSGTALYRLEFTLDESFPAVLDLGEIAHTARVRINGKDAGTCWTPPHRIDASDLLEKGTNVLEIEVSNLAANRITDLDRRKIPWKSFHEINFVNIDYKDFDASSLPPLPSGLLGPVRLLPLRKP